MKKLILFATILLASPFLGDVRVAAQTANQPGSGNALSFDGVNDRVDVGDINAPIFDGVNNQITIEAWINPCGCASTINIPIVTKYNSGTLQMTFLFDVGANGSLLGGVFNNATGEHFIFTPIGVVPYDVWSHVTYVVDLSTATHTLYLNGVSILEDTASPSISGIPPTVFNNTPIPVQIGTITNTAGVNEYGQATLDEVRIWNRALTQTEIRDNLCKKLPDNYGNGLVGYWRFDEGVDNTCTGGQDACDASGNGNNGVKY